EGARLRQAAQWHLPLSRSTQCRPLRRGERIRLERGEGPSLCRAGARGLRRLCEAERVQAGVARTSSNIVANKFGGNFSSASRVMTDPSRQQLVRHRRQNRFSLCAIASPYSTNL